MSLEKQIKDRPSPRAKRTKTSAVAGKQSETPREGQRGSLSAASGADRHSRIAALAYLLYERHGCQTGRDLDHWLEAEQQILSQEHAPESVSGSRELSPN